MGTTVYRCESKAKAVQDELKNQDGEVLDHRVIGASLWILARYRFNGRVSIGLSRINYRNGEAAIKAIHESMGPYYFNCPTSFLDRADPPENDSATKWRAQVRRIKVGKKRAPLKLGTVIKYCGVDYILTENLGRRGWLADDPDKRVWRLLSTQVAASEILNPETEAA